MTAGHTGNDRKSAPVKMVTTDTGRILRISPEDEAARAAAAAAATPAPANVDPARRADVLFRVRRAEGHELSSWWMIGAFVVTSGLVIALLSWVPYSA
ncbi:hypothetical protein HD600_002125 [Microbacterium ginsengiterrae]|uniref:UDP-N-acetylmuramyl pentapeptide phosphotransferase n=1 Tax=Microbacterium ginsengiterrae TaxID=546115 RepID=A0A7W9CDQ6_9MICO|nr:MULTISPECIES: hypothetical protein [Microbacterium]MBB5743628.1 hypothetical protein [Microbacterium ginsengiterrae]